MSREISSVDTIVAEVSERLNVLSANEEDAIIRDINQCTNDVALSFPQAPFLQTSAKRTLSSGTSEYAVPSDFEKAYSIRHPGNDTKLTYLPVEQFDTFIPDLDTSGNPTIYTITNGGTFKYAPVPGSSLDIEIRYQKKLGTVSAQSATPPLPSKYNELYLLWAESKGLARAGNRAESRLIRDEYELLKKRMIEDLSEMTSENIPIRSIREFRGGVRDYGDPIKNIYGN